jgi:Arc/MetJ family transcription regulator
MRTTIDIDDRLREKAHPLTGTNDKASRPSGAGNAGAL